MTILTTILIACVGMFIFNIINNDYDDPFYPD